MSFASNYLLKYSYCREGIVETIPSAFLSIIVTLPCYREDKVIQSLESLYSCHRPEGEVEVLILINYPETTCSEERNYHLKLYNHIQRWCKIHQLDRLKFYPILKELPDKDAGVGLARKILMDEAVRRFNMLNKPDGIIAGFDADCICSNNYFIEIEKAFVSNKKLNACSIYFEHPIRGNEFSREIYEAIILYELYLRYYVEGLRFAGYPYAFHTLGSSFAVTAKAYALQGGMNKRKAGEDFYFLNKVMLLGGYGEINGATVFPSPRISDRVPFGTGAAVKRYISNKFEGSYTYHPQSFIILKQFIEKIDSLYSDVNLNELQFQMHPILLKFLLLHNWEKVVDEIRKNAGQLKTFKKRFFQWFDGLKVLQAIKYMHNNGINKVPIEQAVITLLELNQISCQESQPQQLLYILREKQKTDHFYLR